MSEHHKVIIIGSGPAGFTAAIYTGRSLLDTVIFEGSQPGGQLTITTEVENYPGFPDGVQGPEMMEILRKQAHKFGAKSIYETINKVDFSKRPLLLLTENEKEYTADSVIIATGATARRLHGNGESKYWGYGISACATCDGFFFRNQHVYVIGGGDTAMEEAMYLTHFASKVTVIHRRNELRASKIMAERAKANPKIDWEFNYIVDEFIGKQNNGVPVLTGLKLKNTKTNEYKEVTADGVFYALGHEPNTKIFGDFLEKDENGYLITKPGTTYTNIPGVFACGDVQDSIYKQAVTAAGSGCMAAIDAERWLSEHN